ncbi:FtsB family cell division protein [Isobaculum melis]|uniref:Cell division protein DivIC n=1 Tax=Isobaculum melis TaxID=142588 RepID=A0A1H9SMN8_9LACT|nr:septum formation initiator family protein [Isobaculum melis]SER86201.1 cell division protein DivIC [Isobaculum melis]
MNRRTKKNKKIESLQNDYTQEKTLEARKRSKSKRNMRRRMSLMLVVGCVLIGLLIVRVFNNQARIKKIEQEKIEATAELRNVEQLQRNLQNRVTQLQDESFLAKLARSKYYLSKDGELIFRMPEEEEESDSSKKQQDATAENEKNADSTENKD